ncbi:MAG: DegV family protein [Armatimonadota bacterium]|nr:DegV family protein [Armatimonadota bacterium]MDR7612680.1 DegV family protein [Armatimonadota bacterium]
MPPPVAVLTESTGGVPPDLCRELEIGIVPVWIVHRGRSYRDGVDVTPEQFDGWLREGPPYPTTSAPSPADFLDAYRAAAARGAAEIVVLALHAGLSGSWQNAHLAAADSPVPVHVVDTRTAAAAEGLLVVETARRLRAGETTAQVLRWLEGARFRARLVAAVPDLRHLVRSGRVPGLAATLADRAGVKPLFSLAGGTIRPAGVARTLEGVRRRLVAGPRRDRSRTRRLLVAVTHADAPLEADLLAAKLRDDVRPDELWVVPFTPVMAAHTGPGVLGVAWLGLSD